MYELKSQQVTDYFATARERYKIYLRRCDGKSPPFSKDAAFVEWRFCNVFRELDRVTKWIRNNVREPLRNNPKVYLAMVICRLFNKIETLEVIREHGLFDLWDSNKAREVLKDLKPIVGAAYVVKTPDGMNKLDGVLHMVDTVAAMVDQVPSSIRHRSLKSAWKMLMNFPCIGKFMAYEIVSDLRHIYLLENASDINTWANAGPGACLGLSYLVNDSSTIIRYGSKKTEDVALHLMEELLYWSKVPEMWPVDWPRWEMREVEHWLCEYAKWYKVTHLGMRMKRRFN